jgi:hypothetical protein
MAHDHLLAAEAATFKIPRRAWVVALVSLLAAEAALYAVPGPAYEGCLMEKNCGIHPLPPALVAGAVLLLGAGVSVWLGRIPRHWVVGWSAATAGIAAFMLAGAPLALSTPMHPATWRIAIIGFLLCFCALWVLQIGVGLVATLVPCPFGPRLQPTKRVIEDRPRWQREASAVLAALEGGRAKTLTASESQLVAELVFTLEADDDAPPRLTAQLRSILSGRAEGASRQAAVLALVRAVTTPAAARDPYRPA